MAVEYEIQWRNNKKVLRCWTHTTKSVVSVFLRSRPWEMNLTTIFFPYIIKMIRLILYSMTRAGGILYTNTRWTCVVLWT